MKAFSKRCGGGLELLPVLPGKLLTQQVGVQQGFLQRGGGLEELIPADSGGGAAGVGEAMWCEYVVGTDSVGTQLAGVQRAMWEGMSRNSLQDELWGGGDGGGRAGMQRVGRGISNELELGEGCNELRSHTTG